MRENLSKRECVPNFAEIWIQANSTAVRVKSVSVLVDLIIEYSNGTPEGRISPISISAIGQVSINSQE